MIQADIWSIGVIFFQMVFGELPFTSKTNPELIQEITHSEMLKNQQFEKNGIIISKTTTDFIKLILVEDQYKRIDWRELVKHPIFRKKQVSRLPISQITDIPII
jgi:serine/threonine protein kinase